MGHILIAGGTGLLGSRLATLLREKGYETAILSRRIRPGDGRTYLWDPGRGTIDPEAIRQAVAVINLTGAGIADTWWTPARKRILIESRTRPTDLLRKTIESTTHQVGTYISGSAIGIYGNTGEELLTEEHPPGADFMAQCIQAWETAFKKVEALPLQAAALRMGIVLSAEGGALPRFLIPFKFRVGSYFGNGRQWYSWIHIDDVCRMYIHLLENPGLHGRFNAVAPNPVSCQEMVTAIGNVLGGPNLIAPLPAFLLRAALGEMADTILNSNRVSCGKMEAAGFHFRFPWLEPALSDLLKK